MSARLGLSSGSVPRLSAAELAALTRAGGGEVVDLRTGKGQRWEHDGIPALDGLPVAFVGVSLVLGRDDAADGLAAARRFPGRPVKVFAAEGAARARITLDQIATLSHDREPRDILVETHRGGAAPAELAELCHRHGCALVIDNLGLHEISGHDDDPHGPHVLRELAALARAVQVKGFTPARPGERPRHRALTETDLTWLDAFAGRAPDITVESRAGTPAADLAVLGRAWRDLTCACP
ncbi:hypothetical protein [Spongiactinospora sp. TRM90649]|uniref:hypothetical protein n=1 Tax=Spongiactinospora sp. TRM90649 TaxID=3031114 RepID=UPI0023F8D9A4|nr:hypothetical protein [Spongiactinospora sp. TRM90649]MDF5757690.1 hypothetical protein [Spongiactinospora sp. TRM90649]